MHQQMTNSKWSKFQGLLLIGSKTLKGEEKMLATRIFSFSYKFFSKKLYISKSLQIHTTCIWCNFTFLHNVFYAICILKFFNSNISFVFCSFFEFGMVSKLCIRERAKQPMSVIRLVRI